MKKTAPPAKTKKPAAKKTSPRKTTARVPKDQAKPEQAEALTALERRFCEEYLIDLNGTQAYLRVKPGANEASARVASSRMLAKTNIRAEIARLRAELSAKTGLTAERVLLEVGRLAMFDVRKLFNSDGSPKDIQTLDDDTAAALAGLDVVAIGNSEMGVGKVVKYKLADKGANLERLMKHLGLFAKDNAQAGAAAGGALSQLLKEMRRSSLPVVQNPNDE